MRAAWWGDERVREAVDLPARLALGGAMLYHGLAKLRGSGPEDMAPFFESLGFRPGKRWVRLTGAAETFAGVAAILGIGTRPAALVVLATQAVAVWKVHRPKGFDVMKGGMEYNLALMALASGLLVEGPRAVSAHHALRKATARRSRGPRGIARLLARRGKPAPLERVMGWLH
jgi:putative oxidoreductase